jgi:hypothetical protein
LSGGGPSSFMVPHIEEPAKFDWRYCISARTGIQGGGHLLWLRASRESGLNLRQRIDETLRVSALLTLEQIPGFTLIRERGGSMRSGQLARLARVSSDTLRHYERVGILPLPARTAENYRDYPPSSLRRVELIQRALTIGSLYQN